MTLSTSQGGAGASVRLTATGCPALHDEEPTVFWQDASTLSSPKTMTPRTLTRAQVNATTMSTSYTLRSDEITGEGAFVVLCATGRVTAPFTVLPTAACGPVRAGDYLAPDYRGQGAVQMVDATHGWAVLGTQILHTVGVRSLRGTIDDGNHWQTLTEPGAPLLMVHFVTPSEGWGVANGTLYRTHGGGEAWQAEPAPCPAERVCFESANDGWLGSRDRIYRSVDAGRHWRQILAVPSRREYGWQDADLQCSRQGSAWAYFTGYGAASNHAPYVAYHCDAARGRCVPVFKENYIDDPPASTPVAWLLATDRGRTLSQSQPIAAAAVNGSADPLGVSFANRQHGWLATTFDCGWQLLATVDAGATWTRQVLITTPQTC